MTSRYAIYYAPDAASDLWRFGTGWLGRDPLSGVALPHPALDDLDADFIATATESPRHYGFHATLKAPFALAEGTYAAHLVHALGDFASHQTPFPAPPLELTRLGDFLALTLSEPDERMAALAEACTRQFDRFRAPPSEAELEKRRAAGLSARQEELLAKWGYPYVMEAFRFHLSLTGRLSPADLDRTETALRQVVAPLCVAPLPVGSVCLYWQKDRTTPFTLIRRFAFGPGGD